MDSDQSHELVWQLSDWVGARMISVFAGYGSTSRKGVLRRVDVPVVPGAAVGHVQCRVERLSSRVSARTQRQFPTVKRSFRSVEMRRRRSARGKATATTSARAPAQAPRANPSQANHSCAGSFQADSNTPASVRRFSVLSHPCAGWAAAKAASSPRILVP